LAQSAAEADAFDSKTRKKLPDAAFDLRISFTPQLGSGPRALPVVVIAAAKLLGGF
jgi:hypothetical protein